MSFEYFTQGFNGQNDKPDGLPRFPHENEQGRPYELVPGRTATKIKNPTIQKYLLSISRAIVELHKISEGDDKIIADFSDSVAKIDHVIDRLRPRAKHFKNVQPKVDHQRSVSPINNRPLATKQAEPPAAEKPTQQKPAAQKALPSANPFRPHTAYTHSILPPNYITPPVSQQRPEQNQSQSQIQQQVQAETSKRSPVNDQEYVSLSGLQQSKEIAKSTEFNEQQLNRIDSFSHMDSYTDIPGGKSYTEPDYKHQQNPFSSLEEKLNYLINERKAVEKSARVDSKRQLLPQNIRK